MSILDYSTLVENAMRGVIKDILCDVAKNGLRENSYFYINFLTNYPGVVLPEHLKQRYPEDMTVVLQYQFWDLDIQEDNFSVTLSFNRHKEAITIPYLSIMSFEDRGADFELELTPPIPPEDDHPAPVGDDDNTPSDKRGKVITLDIFRKKK